MGCLICGRPAEIAHLHGGSITEAGFYRGKGKKPPDWLVAPLCPEHHRVEYGGYDASPKRWELQYGNMVAWLLVMRALTGIDAMERARAA
jgi:hypothetical protein